MSTGEVVDGWRPSEVQRRRDDWRRRRTLRSAVIAAGFPEVGIVMLALGYILLSGGGSDDPNVFNPAMFDTRRLVVAPILIVLGFVVEIVAIMFKKK